MGKGISDAYGERLKCETVLQKNVGLCQNTADSLTASPQMSYTAMNCRKSLVSPEKALDMSLYASQDELQAFCQTWGLNGVRELATATQAALADAVNILDAALKMHEPLLQRLKAEYLVGSPLIHMLLVLSLCLHGMK